MAREQALAGPSTQPTLGPWSCPHGQCQCQEQQTPAETALRGTGWLLPTKPGYRWGQGNVAQISPTLLPKEGPQKGKG